MFTHRCPYARTVTTTRRYLKLLRCSLHRCASSLNISQKSLQSCFKARPVTFPEPRAPAAVPEQLRLLLGHISPNYRALGMSGVVYRSPVISTASAWLVCL